MAEHSEEKKMHPPRRNAVEISPNALTNQEKRLRMVVLGASWVGKTQLVSRFLDRPFNQSYLPTVEEFHRTKYIIRGRTYQLDILDTAGQNINPAMQNLTLLTADLFLIVYSVTDRSSWERAKDIVASVEDIIRDPERTNKCIERSFKNLLHANGSTIQCDKDGIQEWTKSAKTMSLIPIFVVGNQCDASNVAVQSHETTEWMRCRALNPAFKIDHIFASAKTNFNVQTLYDRLFAMSKLPAELSPNMHKRVSESEYLVNTASRERKSKSWKCGRPKSEEFGKISIKSVGKRILHSGGLSSTESWSTSSSDCDDKEVSQSLSAIASVTLNQRRPSVDTEVLLAITKVRSYVLELERKNKSRSSYSVTAEKFKRQMNKLKVSSNS